MTYEAYQQLFDYILSKRHCEHPYDDEHYMNYTRLNQARMKRWDKHLELSEELIQGVKSLRTKQHWIIITEPWCGDAAHILPFLMRLVQHNLLITYELQLRDSPPFLIQSYLTNGSKSIPKLIVRDEKGNDIFTWGPRPKGAQELFYELRAQKADAESSKIALQNWYNNDKGISLCKELLALFTLPSSSSQDSSGLPLTTEN
jgi:hypothetical protein